MIDFVRAKRGDEASSRSTEGAERQGGYAPPVHRGVRASPAADGNLEKRQERTAFRHRISGARRKLRDVQVRFLSLVPAAANQRTVLVKSAEGSGRTVLEKELSIARTDALRRIVYGIVYAPDEVDTDGDTIDADEIEKAAYDFMHEGRTGQIDSDHDGVPGKGFVAESWIIRPGDPLFTGETPGAWAVGIKVTDAGTWQRLEKGELRGISMAGLARPEAIAKADTADSHGRVEEEPGGGMIARLRKMLGLDDAQRENPFDERRLSGIAKANAVRDEVLLDLATRTEALTARVEAMERQTAGRQTVLGGTHSPLRKGKRFKGVQIL